MANATHSPQGKTEVKPATARNFLEGMTPAALVKLPVAFIVNLPIVREYIGEEVAANVMSKYGDGVLGDLDPLDLATIAMAAMSQTTASSSVPDEIPFICPTCGDVHVISLNPTQEGA